MTIRLETPQDYREVENLTREAFWNVYRPGCTEHYVLNQYRSNPDFIPELDFVMEHDGKIMGHVMFSKAEIILDDGTHFPSWTFGPISIHPDYQGKGYGLKLLNYSLEKAREMGIGLLCMEGKIGFYSHAGFDLASKRKIHYHDEPRESEVPYFLAQELIPGYWGSREGTYTPPKGYFVAEEQSTAFENYDNSFPKKTKTFNKFQLPPFCEKAKLVMQTERILLRPWLESDVESLFKYASDPDVGPRAGWSPHKSVEESLEIIRTIFNNDTNWAIVWKETGEAIGAIGYMATGNISLPARKNEPLVGYWVARPYWNRGICTEALQLVIAHIRKTTDIRSLISGHFVDNPASGRVMMKCGFVPTGEECFDETLSNGKDKPISVLRLELS